jgi:hypothetical protein
LDQRPEVVLCYPKTRFINEEGLPTEDYDDRLNLQSDSPNQRLRLLLWKLVLCNACYGLMRASVLKRTKLYGTYFSSDRVFLAELVLHGPFVEVPEYLFFRRMHAGIAVRRYANCYEAMVMSEPDAKGKLFLPNWNIFIGHLTAIYRAPLSWAERLRCYARMHIWLRRCGLGLLEDLKVTAKQLLGRIRHRSNVECGSKS